FKGDEITGFLGGKNKYRLDTGESPRELHIHFLDGKLKGNTLRIIYALEKDELKLCFPLDSQNPCPTEFKTNARRNLLLLVLHRKRCGRRQEARRPRQRQAPVASIRRGTRRQLQAVVHMGN